MYGKHLTFTIRNFAVPGLSAICLAACLSGGDSSESGFADSPNPPPPSNSAPQISGTPAEAVVAGTAYLFMPNASDPDGDTLTFRIENIPSWAKFNTGNGELSGQPTAEHVGLYENITISASDGQVTDSLPQFSISVDASGEFSTTLSWTAPTQNEDGSPLTDLIAYKIYWGTIPGSYPNSVRIDNPGITSYVVDNLSAGTYEFVATAINSDEIESAFSNAATKTFQ